MKVLSAGKKLLKNRAGSLEIDLFGGAITNFNLHKNEINPLDFRFSKEQMPENNKSGAPYQGHFLCLGRWGEPSEGEIKAGLPNHGHIANILWKAAKSDHLHLEMQATSQLEGLHINRNIEFDIDSCVFTVNEEITNINPLGRLYNMVQHPTLAGAFLDQATIISCNAETGFDFIFGKEPAKHVSTWPHGICRDMTVIDLGTTTQPYSSVFSFIVKKGADLGWVTAYSPTCNLVIGYAWRRKDYPWINLWQHWHQDKIRYRGIEFGTTGIHKPFREIIEDGNGKVFGENTFEYIDAGEKLSKRYLSFLCSVEPGFKGVDEVSISKGVINIKSNVGQNILMQTNIKV